MTEKLPILVTSALPYANGPIHIGHLVEYIQTDIWVRYQKMEGKETYYFCADDTHGTPVMIAAQKRGISPEELVAEVQKQHYRDLTSFDIVFDNYYSTNSPENRELSETIYLAAKEKGHIVRKKVRQLYCEHDKMFLPDRFVKGTCPKCGALDQYGDSCEVCGATYRPEDLKDPRCAVCSNVPISKEEAHLFFQLSDFQEYLENWIQGRVDEGVARKLQEWIQQGLKDWDISRDGPYFGFEIPGEKNKFFYVWLDAPVGYMASAKNYFNSNNQAHKFDLFWNIEFESQSEVYHFIGKDIVYFHTLFWPAMLKAGGFRAPSAVFVHGFLTLNGEKMSKSRGTLIRAETYLKHFDPAPLRYFYASRLGVGLDDIDLAVTDFISRYNSAVVGNYANLFSRLCTKIAGELDQQLSDQPSVAGQKLCKFLLARKDEIRLAYQDRNTNKVLRIIESLSDEVNRFIADREPWKLIKTDKEATRQVVTDALNAGLILSYYLRPILPVFCDGVTELLAIPSEWSGLFDDLNETNPLYLPPKHKIREYRHLASRIHESEFNAMIEDEKKVALSNEMSATATTTKEASKTKAIETKETKATKATKDSNKKNNSIKNNALKSEDSLSTESGIITIDELSKVELRVALIKEASLVEGADKLLRLSLDVGESKLRNVFAGIRSAYNPEELVGLLVVCVANLQPRKMKFGVSEAMILASGDSDSLTLFVPHRNAKPGDRLR